MLIVRGSRVRKESNNCKSIKEIMTKNPHAPNPDISLTLGSSSSPSPSIVDDIDLPIALKKGVRSCVKYPIVNYVSYNALSPSTHSFFHCIVFYFYSQQCV